MRAVELLRIFAALPPEFEVMRAEARSEGYNHVERLATEWESGSNRYYRECEALLQARLDGDLAAIGGRTIDPVIPHALRLRRFYVRPSYRHRGIGRALATALVEQGRLMTVNAGTAHAGAFWQALGFTPNVRDGHTHELHGPIPK